LWRCTTSFLNALPLLSGFPANLSLHTNLQTSSLIFSPPKKVTVHLLMSPRDLISVVRYFTKSPQQAQSWPYMLHISPGDTKEVRLLSFAQVHQSCRHKKMWWWHSVLAGAVVGAVAVSFEKRSRVLPDPWDTSPLPTHCSSIPQSLCTLGN
jgi:hypothetical protein